MGILYNLGIQFYLFVMKLASMFNEKAAKWVDGRKNWRERLGSGFTAGGNTIWIHCASLGEFEQGRPLIEELKMKSPEIRIFLTFFSPSGYEIRKDYDLADCVFYLPPDTPRDARQFIDIVKPSMVVFVKYEFWNNYLTELNKRKIPVYLVSGIFQPGQHFFRWYGSFFRKMLFRFERFFVQDEQSKALLAGIGIENAVVTGDTRFDRVVKIANEAREIPVIERFRGHERLFLAGSSWRQDEEIIAEYINKFPARMKWVFAPHEIDTSNIERLEKLFKVKSVRFSCYDKSENAESCRVLIIDNIGMLSSAYRYAYIAEVGGGFGKGIHNVLEAVCWGVPVLFGPDHEKFREAIDLKNNGGAKTFKTYSEFRSVVDLWLDDENQYKAASGAALKYTNENTGATRIILSEMGLKDINSNR